MQFLGRTWTSTSWEVWSLGALPHGWPGPQMFAKWGDLGTGMNSHWILIFCSKSQDIQDIQDQSPIFFFGSFWWSNATLMVFVSCHFVVVFFVMGRSRWSLAGLHPRILGLLSRGCLRHCSISSGVGRACGWLGSAASSQVFVSKWRIYRQFDGQFHGGLRSHKISRSFIQTKTRMLDGTSYFLFSKNNVDMSSEKEDTFRFQQLKVLTKSKYLTTQRHINSHKGDLGDYIFL